jgi:nucleoside-diphosphate-sugar epimerase
MNYFIFGGSGFIGTHLINRIIENNSDAAVYNLDIAENSHNSKSVFIPCDVRKPISLPVQATGDDVIFNLAAIHKTPGHPDREYFETNIRGAENVCAFAEKYGIKKIVFTSSIAPYGASEELKEETALPMPNTPYGISKLVAEKIHQIWQAKDRDRQLTAVRPGVVFGKGENGNFTRLYWGIRKRSFFYAGRKDTVKACIYVKELADFMLHRLENHSGGVELFNCTYEPAFTIEQTVETMKKVTGLKRHIIKINGTLLMFAAGIIGSLGGKKLGIHPARVKKLMVSTDCPYQSGKKIREINRFQDYVTQCILQKCSFNPAKYLSLHFQTV